jgi:signal transduction histidine kinase
VGRRLRSGQAPDGLVIFPNLRRLGVAWVIVTIPLITWVSTTVRSPDGYIFVLIYLACGAYTTPALLVGAYAVVRVPDDCRAAFRILYAGLVLMWSIGVAMLIGVGTGWTWANVAGLPAVALAGAAQIGGVAMIVRTRSGRRAISVDVVEAAAAVVALTAPVVVLWGPSIWRAEASWFTVPASLILVFTVAGIYWTALLCVRLGPGRRTFEGCALAISVVGTVNVALQIAQGVSGFGLWAPPLVFLNAVTVSMYFLVPLYAPVLLPPGLGLLPPQDQVRGTRMGTVVALGGLGVLLVATAAVAGERPWVVAYALAVVSVLFVLAALRQWAATAETRRLYRQVEIASEERGRLLTEMLERSVDDRRRFARQLHEQAVSAAASFATLAGAGYAPHGYSPLVTEASALVRGELGRHADSLRDLMMAIRPRDGSRQAQARLRTPIAAHFASVYGDGPSPCLTVDVADDLVLDWVTETVVLQIVHEALHNVWRHSNAGAVDVVVSHVDGTVTLRVTDDGVGFDPSAVPEGPGLASMRSSATVVGGSVEIRSGEGEGTTIDARLGDLGGPWPEAPRSTPHPAKRAPTLRLVPSP